MTAAAKSAKVVELVPRTDNAIEHVLPSGGKVWLRQVDHLRARDVKAIIHEINGKVDGTDLALVMLAMSEALIKVMVAGWELPYAPEDEREWALPSADPTMLDELRAVDYNRLRGLVEPVAAIVMPNAGAPERGAGIDPDSPTPPANG